MTEAQRVKALTGASGTAALVLAGAATFIPPLEGRLNDPYYDIAHVLTVCDGITGPDVQLRHYSNAECDALFKKHAGKHYAIVASCVPSTVPVPSQVAFVSLTYNAAGEKFCTTTMAAKARAGDLAGACAEFSRWTFVKGKDCRDGASRCGGIVERRKKERALCESGLPKGLRR